MKTRFFVLFSLVAVVVLSMTSCYWVSPGYVGLRVYEMGTDKGKMEVLPIGRHTMGFYKKYYSYPIFVKQYPFTQATTEGSPTDEAFYFQSKEGIKCNVDVAVQAKAISEKVPDLFKTYNTEMETIIHVNIRSYLRDGFIKYGSSMTIDDLYSPAKVDMLKKIESDLKATMGPVGVEIVSVSYLSDIRFPKDVEDAIVGKIKATQDALKAQNQVVQATAEAKIAIEKAKGEAEANKLKQASLSNTVIEWQQLMNEQMAITKWDGKLPQVTGGAIPFVNLATQTDTTAKK
jgi:regulator of protease activity HflC (stomatin/prohibitin superfamily)